MRKYILFILLLILASCGVQKKTTTKQEFLTKIDSAQIILLNKKLSESEKMNLKLKDDLKILKAENIKLHQNFETSKTTYDTDKPIVPGTNKPPVKEESTTHKISQKEIDNKTQMEYHSNLNVDNSFFTNMIFNLQQENKYLLDQKKKLKDSTIVKNTTWDKIKLILISFLVGLSIGVIWKFIKPISNFFKILN